MHVPAQDRNQLRGHVKDKRVLKYLREMIRICRHSNRRWVRMEYERAWEFAVQVIYGPLPVREDFSTGDRPDSIVSRVPAGFRSQHPLREWPLRKIVKRFSREWNHNTFKYETLECAHIVQVPPGYNIPVKSRRCAACLAETLAKKKKPAASVAEVPQQKKAVSA